MFSVNYFYLFFILIIISALFVVITDNPVESVFFLVLVFLFSSVLFLLIGAEFIAVFIVVVYVGAISILFLFVVMMLNIKIVELSKNSGQYLPIISLIGVFIFVLISSEIFLDLGIFYSDYSIDTGSLTIWASYVKYKNNVGWLGWVLFYHYPHFVLFSGIVLLIAMIGSIVLLVDYSETIEESGSFHSFRLFTDKFIKKFRFMNRNKRIR